MNWSGGLTAKRSIYKNIRKTLYTEGVMRELAYFSCIVIFAFNILAYNGVVEEDSDILLPSDTSLPSTSGDGPTYYVSTKGSDSNPGTQDAPWATPGYASKQLEAGDTLIILGGTYILSEYYEDMITLENSGTDGAWITIKGEEGNTPVLAGRDNLYSAVYFNDVSYIRIENLEITSDNGAWFRDGINADDRSLSHIMFSRLNIHHIDEFGLNLRDVDELLVDNCNIHHCGFGAIGGPGGEAGGWRNVVIQKSQLSYNGHYYQGGDGTNRPYDRPDGFGIEPSNGPIEIVDCIVEHNRGDGLDSKAANTYIHNCIVANNSCDGIKLWGDNSKVHNCLIYGTGDGVPGGTDWAAFVITTETANASFEMANVTIHDTPRTQNYPMYVQYGSDVPINLTMRNTIVADGYGPVYIEESVNFTAEHNLFYRSGDDVQVEANGREYTTQQIESGSLGKGNICGNPLFVKPAWGAEGDYHLKQGSPAIDSGMDGAGVPTIDLEYNPRPRGNGYDMGVYEFIIAMSPPAERTLSITSTELYDSPGDDTFVHLSINDTSGIAGASVLIKYDPELLVVGDVLGTDLVSDMNLVINTNIPGEIRLELASTVEMPEGSGALVDIGLTVTEDAQAGTETILELSEDTEMYDSSGSAISFIGQNGTVKIIAGCVKGDVNGDGNIRSNDAILALKIAALMMEATPAQECAADMNDDGKVRSNDAILILNEAAGVAAPKIDLAVGINKHTIITLADVHGIAGERVTVPLKVNNISGLAGGDISIVYDSNVLRAVDVSSDAGILLAGNVDEPGIVHIAFAGTGSLSSEILAEISFSVLNDAASSLEFRNVKLYSPDALPMDSRKLDGKFVSWAMPPEESSLLQNFPNPFNPETWIPYQLRTGGEVAVCIYNTEGKMVRELNLGYRPAGIYVSRDRAAYWDGRNASGEKAASGVYFYKLRTGDYTSTTRKMIILQ